MSTPLVLLDISGPDVGRLRRFYHDVFGWGDGSTGEVVVPSPDAVRLAIRPDAAEKRLYLGVDDVGATLDRVVAAGGARERDRFEVGDGMAVGLFRDPAGNAMAVIELVDGRPPLRWAGAPAPPLPPHSPTP